MEYVAIGILALLVVGGGITMLVLAGTKGSAPAVAEDADGTAAPFAGTDHTPLGDTAEHHGEQDEHGYTVTPGDAGPRRGEPETEPSGGRFKRDPIGGEAEGSSTVPLGEVPHPRE
jgi:hypothetical protein